MRFLSLLVLTNQTLHDVISNQSNWYFRHNFETTSLYIWLIMNEKECYLEEKMFLQNETYWVDTRRRKKVNHSYFGISRTKNNDILSRNLFTFLYLTIDQSKIRKPFPREKYPFLHKAFKILRYYSQYSSRVF